jgi:hypothetical protein
MEELSGESTKIYLQDFCDIHYLNSGAMFCFPVGQFHEVIKET